MGPSAMNLLNSCYSVAFEAALRTRIVKCGLVGDASVMRNLSAGMKIATYANARTALEARKGVAPAFMCGKYVAGATPLSLLHARTWLYASARI